MLMPLAPAAVAAPSSWPPRSQISVDEAWRERRDSAVCAESCALCAIPWGVLYDPESSLPFCPAWAPPLACSDPQAMGAQLGKAGDPFARGPGTGSSQTGSSFSASATATSRATQSERQPKLDKDAVHFLQVGSASLFHCAGSRS